MERLDEQHENLLRALKTLKEAIEDMALNENTELRLYKTYRDSVIQRFEYTIELFWKYLKMYLHQEGIAKFVTGSPREIIKLSSDAKLISDEESIVLLRALTDRNLTTHTYVEITAEVIKKAAPQHYAILHKIATRLKPPDRCRPL